MSNHRRGAAAFLATTLISLAALSSALTGCAQQQAPRLPVAIKSDIKTT